MPGHVARALLAFQILHFHLFVLPSRALVLSYSYTTVMQAYLGDSYRDTFSGSNAPVAVWLKQYPSVRHPTKPLIDP